MGFLRVYLALCVISSHSDSVFPWTMHRGREAVEIFFMISGFYMAMVLSQRYDSVKEFYLSRWLRIAVPYYVALIIVIFWSAIAAKTSGNWLQLTPYVSQPLAHNGGAGIAFAALSNITIFFQDWVMFFQHDSGTSFGFTANFSHNQSPLWRYLFMPQCWSVGIELTFYLLVPYINKLRTRTLLGIILVSLIARLSAYHFLGLQHEPWVNRFFPFELALFLGGMIGWRLYSKYDFASKLPVCKKMSSYLFACVLLLVGLLLHVKVTGKISTVIGVNQADLVSYLFLPVAIAALFAYSRRNAVDRFIGELSYPIYLLHLIVIQSLAPLLKNLHIPQTQLGQLAGLITIVLSVIVFLFVIQPFERWRHDFVTRMAQKRTAALDLAG